MQYPQMAKIKQSFNVPKVDDIATTITQEMQAINLSEQIKPGMRIAITAGSRGINQIDYIISCLVQELRARGAEPFIIPTMGSHGGATAEGQIEVLAGLGITQQRCGCPIYSTMEVAEIGVTKDGVPVYLDRFAAEADGIILVGRVKPHTDFRGDHESGLVKMAAIGLGKHAQALALHSYGIRGLRDLLPEVAKVTLERSKILCGIAIVENAREETALIKAIETKNIYEEEKQILLQAKNWMASLPIQNIDILLVDQMGKNYSGTGMDTNIIGRIKVLGVDDQQHAVQVKYIHVSNLSEPSHGNALGVGMADTITQRLYEKIDRKITYENVSTSTFLERAKIPMVLENDRTALDVLLRANWGIRPEKARIVRIENTLHIEDLYVSMNIYDEIINKPNITGLSEAAPLRFEANGNFLAF
jgi:hypothetical protein